MNNEILEIAKHLKNKITSGEGVDEYHWQDIIDVCNEVVRINDLKPVGYVHEKELNFKSGFDDLQCAFLYPCKDDYSDIPLYRLDK